MPLKVLRRSRVNPLTLQPERPGERCSIPPGGDSLLVSDGGRGGQTFFGFVKRCLVYLWVRDLEHNRYIFGVADEKIGEGEC